MTFDFTKTPDEEFFRYHEFKRIDGQGVLATGETITGASVIVTGRDSGTDYSASMVSDVAAYGSPLSTQIQYKVRGGVAGQEYFYKIQAVTDAGQKFESILTCEVLHSHNAQK